MIPETLCFVVESSTDVRIADGLAQQTDSTALGRTITGGRVISRETEHSITMTTGPASRLRFAARTFREMVLAKFETRAVFDRLMIQLESK